ncbi:MAG: serine hydrolase [Gemmatimonadaceae bacterium]|nr:serine hydrolase [Gemmatimonadaceae bacterium]
MHPRILLSAAVLCTASLSTRLPAQGFLQGATALRERLVQRIAATRGAEVGLFIEDLATGATLGVGDTVSFHAASTMKVPVMFELFRRADEGTLDLDARIPLANDFRSIVDGSPYALSASDDSDDALYDRVGAPISYRELNERMIVRSSNLATNVLIDRLDATRVTAFTDRLGGAGVLVRRGVEDGPAFRAGLNNVTTARGLGKLLAALERGQVASVWATQAMRETLMRQEFNDEIPAGLPAGTRVAHKTGWITATTHDAAIVYPAGGRPFVLVILTRAIPERADATRLMVDLTRIVWEEYAARSGATGR